MAGEVRLQCTPSKANFQTLNTPQMAYVLLEVMPTEVMANVQMPLNFCFVLDHSGSMSGQKIRDLRDATKLALDQMTPQDYVSVVIFDNKVEVLVPSQPVTDRDAVKRKIDKITANGGTQMSKGMTSGMQELQKQLNPQYVSRMLLLTDGQTYGDEAQCKSLAQQCGGMNVPIAALGLGDDWNEELLDDIASASNGGSDFIDDPIKITTHFQRTVQEAQGAVVQNANLVLRLVQGVTPRQVWRVLPMINKLDHRAMSDRDIQVYLGELEKGQGQSVLAELLVSPRQAGRFRAAQAEVSYDIVSSNMVGEKVRADVILNFTPDPALAQQYDPRIMNLVEKVSAFKLQTRALDEAKMGDIAGATQKLRAAATRLLNMGETELAQTAQQEADNLQQQGKMSSAGTKKLHYETRKLTQRLG